MVNLQILLLIDKRVISKELNTVRASNPSLAPDFEFSKGKVIFLDIFFW